jgi:protein TonB
MESNKILQADVLDILFEGKNKDYGAYELRKKYNKRITLALIIMACLAGGAVLATVLAKELQSKDSGKVIQREMVIQNVQDEPDQPPPPPPPKTPPPPKVETAKFTPPVIKKDEEVPPEEIPPVQEMEKKAIGTENIKGKEDEGDVPLPPVDENKEIIEKPKEDPNQIFEKVEIEASVDTKAWTRHLTNQLQRYIEEAASNGMEPGTYTVQVKFLVEKDGSIADVQALNDPGFGLAKGAVDVVKKGPTWRPGIQNGKPVRSYHTQPITFMINNE